MFFLLNVLIIVVVFSFISLFHQQSYIWQNTKEGLNTLEFHKLILFINKWTSRMVFIQKYNKYRLHVFNHAPLIEFFWTITPTIMLIFMGWPSFKVLYAMEQLIDPIHTIIIIGNQWYRTYSYSDFDIVSDFIKQLDSDNFLSIYLNKVFKYNNFSEEQNYKFNTFDAINEYFVVETEFQQSISKALNYNEDCGQTLSLSDDKPVEIIAIDDKPVEIIAIDDKPVEIIAIDDKPVEITAIDDKPVEITAIDDKSIEMFFTKTKLIEPVFYKLIDNDFLKNLNDNYLLYDQEYYKIIDKKKLIHSMTKYLRKFDESKIIYDCVLLSEDNLPIGYPRLLSTDQVLILPAYVSIRMLVTSVDVIHSWALPSHGIKMDAIPGRINQISFLTQTVGTYWGQCSELCGINHGFMPIEVRVLLLNDYLTYICLNVSYRQDKLILVAERFINMYVLNKIEELEKSIFFEISESFLY